MKRFQFLLLDAVTVIGLFELDLWDTLIEKCDVTITRIVANEAKYASQDLEDIRIDLEPYEQRGLIKIVDVEINMVKIFYDLFGPTYAETIDPGERESLALLHSSDKPWKLCSSDKVVFKVVGLLGKTEQGISLEEILKQIGLSRKLSWKYTKKFREKWTHQGQMDSIQSQGLQ